MPESFGERLLYMRARRHKGLFSIPAVEKAYIIYNILQKGIQMKTLQNLGERMSILAPASSFTSRKVIDGKHRYEAPLIQKFYESLNPNSVVLDIGAHVGLYTLIAGKKARNIHSFEPDPYYRYLLSRNVRRSNVNCTIVGKFVGNEDRRNMVAVDTYCDENSICPTHMKIDIEGYEMFCLQGMKRTLVEYRPKLFIEFHEKLIKEHLNLGQQDIENFFNSLRTQGYEIIFNGHHHQMYRSHDHLYNFNWYSIPPNSVNYACVAD